MLFLKSRTFYASTDIMSALDYKYTITLFIMIVKYLYGKYCENRDAALKIIKTLDKTYK